MKSTARVSLKCEQKIEGQAFRLERGERQDDLISPKLFTCVVEGIVASRKVDWSMNHGIYLNECRNTNLRVADDMVLFAKSPQELQFMLQQMCEHSKSGLKMNMLKTRAMSIGPKTQVSVDGITNDVLPYYSLTKAFWAFKFILLDKTLSRKTKVQALETCVYRGCHTWSLTGPKSKRVTRE